MRCQPLAVGEVATLYRAVGAEEYYSIMSTMQFSIHPRCLPVKYFGLDYNETLDFANMVINIDLVAVLEVMVEKDILDRIGDFTNVDVFLFRKGTVEIQPEYLDEFNKSVISVTHRF